MWRQAARSARPGRRSAPVRWRAAVLRTARLPWYSPFPQPIWASADLALAVAGQGAVVVRQLGPVAAGAPQGGVVQHVDIAAHPGAARQLHLGIADAPADPAGRLHDQKAGHREVALEGAADLAVLDRGVALEQAGLADLQALAVAQVGLDPALDHQLLAGLDLARQADLAADHEFAALDRRRSEEHTSELQSLMRISYAVFCLKKKKTNN